MIYSFLFPHPKALRTLSNIYLEKPNELNNLYFILLLLMLKNFVFSKIKK